MQALLIIDAQNEFSQAGQRPVPTIEAATRTIIKHVEEARKDRRPIAWVRHFNKPHESPAFVPGTWGSEFLPGLHPNPALGIEREFHKDVYGAFTGTAIGRWLKDVAISEVLIVGFYTHGCVSTTAREAIMAGLQVYLDSEATGSCALFSPALGTLSADDVRRTALLHLIEMGAIVYEKAPLH